MQRPDHLDPSFDEIIKDAGTKRLSTAQKLKYMEALHLNERERLVIHEGGYIIGHKEGMEKGEKRGRILSAKQMIDAGFQESDVLKALGLSPDDLTSIK